MITDMNPFKINRIGNGIAIEGISVPKETDLDNVFFKLQLHGKPVYKRTPCRISIPPQLMYDGELLDVVEISDYPFEGCDELEELEIPETVTKIHWNGRGRSKLSKFVVHPDNPVFQSIDGVLYTRKGHDRDGKRKKDWMELIAYPSNKSDNYVIHQDTTKIGNQAFKYTNIEKVNIPDRLVEIGESAFYGCSKLSHVSLPESITHIGGNAFCKCAKLEHIELPSSLSTIEQGTFSECTSLQKVYLPNNVTSIGTGAFFLCSSLFSINVPDNVTFISDHIFEGCSNLRSIIIPKKVTSIGDWAFNGCSLLKGINIPNSVTCIGDHAFQSCTSLESIVIPNSIITIGDSIFEECISLVSIDLPDAIKEIASHMFLGCKSLKIFDIPNSVTAIRKGAFSECSSLANVDIPNSLNCIEDYAFSDCVSLKNINIPISVKDIGFNAFSGCSSLQNIDIPNGIEEIRVGSFSNCISLKRVHVPQSVTVIDDGAFDKSQIEMFTVEKGNERFSSIDGVLFRCWEEEPFELFKYPPAKEQSKYTVDAKIISLGTRSFNDAKQLQYVILHDNIGDLGYAKAFEGCVSLKEIRIPKDVSIIPPCCFAGCEALEYVYIPNRDSLFFDTGAFENCMSLKEIHLLIDNPDNIRFRIGELYDDVFEKSTYDNCILYIPSGTRWAYRHHPILGRFRNIEIENASSLL